MGKFSNFLIVMVRLLSALLLTLTTLPALADEIPLTIDGQINCAHPDNAITTTCRGESNPEPAPAPSSPEPSPTGTTITHSGDTATNCSLPENTDNPRCLPMTINGEINCQHPDNAITTTCWERSQAEKKSGNTSSPEVDCSIEQFKEYPACTGIKPTAVIEYEKSQENASKLPSSNTNLVTKEAAPAGTTITYSGDIAINCALPENIDNNICLPMTYPDGTINCQQADNAITTTCWERSQAEKKAGNSVVPEVDCSLERFKDYPACTGVKPQAVIEYENSQMAVTTPIPVIESPQKNEPKSEVKPQETKPEEVKEVIAEAKKEEVPVSGSLTLKSLSAKSTVISVDLNKSEVLVRVIATKKGAATIDRQFTMGEDGDRTIKFSRNLKGYTIKILVDGEVINRKKL